MIKSSYYLQIFATKCSLWVIHAIGVNKIFFSFFWREEYMEDGMAYTEARGWECWKSRECKKDWKVPLRRVGILKIGEREVVCGVHGNSTQ